VPNILDALDEQQRAAAECIAGPVVIYAGAGTGKTRTITHRIAHGVASGVHDPNQTLAVTFTTRAAGELRSRLGELGVRGVQVRTFHSAALRQLRFFYPQFFNSGLPDLVPSKFRFVADAATLCRVPNDKDTVRDLASEIEWAKVNILSPDSYREKAVALRRDLSGDLTIEKVSKVFEAYLTRMDEAHAMDFEDVLLLTTAMLENYPEMAATVRKQYRHFTVDEFQDVSPVQFELLRQWLGDRDDVCVVGDPAQTIYSFSGATSSYLTDFKSHFGRTQEFQLTHSYRSTEPIIKVANQILAKDATSPVRLSSKRGPGPNITLTSYSSDELEAKTVGSQIATLLESGTNAKEIAILYRINSQSEIFEAELGAIGIPVSLRGAERFFERPEVKNAMLHLRAGLHVTGNRPMGEMVRDILTSTGWKATAPDSGRAARETWESLNTIVDLADELLVKNPAALLPDFVKLLDLRNEMEFAPSANAVTLASIHAAKGLEWEAVFVVGLSEGLLPISHATTAVEFNEERRLLYVALTRAKTYLHLSWAKSRHTDGKGYRDESTLLRGLTL
jgi:DNA helicase-2/ATP-dependent DNA helicase PcrA